MAYGRKAYIDTLDMILKADPEVPDPIINDFIRRLRQDEGFYNHTRATMPLSSASKTSASALRNKINYYFTKKQPLEKAISGRLSGIDKWW